MLDTMGLSPKPQHRKILNLHTFWSLKIFHLSWSDIGIFTSCPIPVADDPDAVAIPERTADKIPKSLSYISDDEKASAQSPPLFGGHQSWSERERRALN